MRPVSRLSSRRGLAWFWAIALGLACSDPLGPQEDRLSAARDRWRGAELDSYAFEFQRSCFCGLPTLRPVFITVTGGTVSSATFADTGEPFPRPLDELPVVEDLFGEIEDAIDRDAFRITAEYDAALGYPISVSIDFEEMVADEEQAFQVRRLTPSDP